MNIALFSGELSGDLIGGALAREIRRCAPDAQIWGLGSQAMQGEGVELLADSAAWGAIGVVEALSKVPNLLFRILPMVKRALRERRPDVVTLIDFGAFNVLVARYAKQLGLKVCYYFPPGAWRRTGSKGAELARITDVVATPFPWSAERFQALGVNAVCVGHPLVERVKAVMTREAFCGHFGMDATRPIIGMLPGSRHPEVTHLMPTLLDAARLIYQRVPETQFVVGVAPSISEEMMAQYLAGQPELHDRLSEIWHEFAEEAETHIWKPVADTAQKLAGAQTPGLVTNAGIVVSGEILEEEQKARRRSEQLRARADKLPPPTVLAKGLTYDVMAHSDVLLTCSGTATLEAALFATPMVILYRGSKIMEFEYRMRGLHRKIQHIGLPNILADRRICPELIQDQATPEAIAEHAITLLNDITARQTARRELSALRQMLGEPGASSKTAEIICGLAEKS
jgi:lipid A disaccharide synthetase